jgi:hypothetical protein
VIVKEALLAYYRPDEARSMPRPRYYTGKLIRTSNFSRNHEQQHAHDDKLHLSRYPAIHTGLVQTGYRGFGGVGWQ